MANVVVDLSVAVLERTPVTATVLGGGSTPPTTGQLWLRGAW